MVVTEPPMVVKRALAAFTDLETGLPMTDIARVMCWVLKVNGSEWEDMEGSLFHTGLGVYAYYLSDDENFSVSSVCFQSWGTADGNVIVAPKVQKQR